MSEHSVTGVGKDTTVSCTETSETFGPGGSRSETFEFCPYCGEDVGNSDHRVDVSVSEVFCETTGMSTYRYCPYCGDQIKE